MTRPSLAVFLLLALSALASFFLALAALLDNYLVLLRSAWLVCPSSVPPNVCLVNYVSLLVPLGPFYQSYSTIYLLDFLIFFWLLCSIFFELRLSNANLDFTKFILMWFVPLLFPFPPRTPLTTLREFDGENWPFWLAGSFVWSILTYVSVYLLRSQLLHAGKDANLPVSPQNPMQINLETPIDSFFGVRTHRLVSESSYYTEGKYGEFSGITLGRRMNLHNIPPAPPTPKEITPMAAALESSKPRISPSHSISKASGSNSQHQRIHNNYFTSSTPSIFSYLKPNKQYEIESSHHNQNLQKQTTQSDSVKNVTNLYFKPPPTKRPISHSKLTEPTSFGSTGTVLVNEESDLSSANDSAPFLSSEEEFIYLSDSQTNSDSIQPSSAVTGTLSRSDYTPPGNLHSILKPQKPKSRDMGSAEGSMNPQVPKSVLFAQSLRNSQIAKPVPIVMTSIGRPQYAPDCEFRSGEFTREDVGWGDSFSSELNERHRVW
ncbi:hypothetical protein HK096_002453 [Nowakowskiella sp. JEL0078]|nr:hypothetical protein HK096_002453 [Nowakowskiella sp. JEL0078]